MGVCPARPPVWKAVFMVMGLRGGSLVQEALDTVYTPYEGFNLAYQIRYNIRNKVTMILKSCIS